MSKVSDQQHFKGSNAVGPLTDGEPVLVALLEKVHERAVRLLVGVARPPPPVGGRRRRGNTALT